MTPATSRPATTSRPPSREPSAAPAIIRAPNALVRGLLRVGFPMGPNTVLTVRGRSSGEPRTAPVAIVEVDGRRYVIGAYGDVHWVRNLRAAGEGVVRLHGRDVPVTAHELSRDEALAFFGETLHAYVGRFPWFGRAFARFLFGLIGPEVLDDPLKAAETRPVFELRAA
jgi:deazaflavin-dependent oxidoreductase (nitroreductase family)